MAYKQDEDFLRFITMGAAGTEATALHLMSAHGHRIVELERYSGANKIWNSKIKRLRLADLVCVDCGRRIEARAKSALEIRMSHSETPGREWDAGLRDGDLCAFVRWHTDTMRAATRPEYFEVGAMRATFGFAKFGPPKAASEGAERDVTWPASVPKADCVVEQVDEASGRVTVRMASGGRRQAYWVHKPGAPTHFYVKEGESIRGNEAMVVGAVPKPAAIDCPGADWDHGADLASRDAADRYTAVKVAGLLLDQELEPELLRVARSTDEDARISLEAWASLARIDPERYTREVLAVARTRDANPALAMEALLILAELESDQACAALNSIAADVGVDEEARCAAVWGLGPTGLNQPAEVLPYIADPSDDVALHAIAAIGDIEDQNELIARVSKLLEGSDREAASAGAVLAEQGEDGVTALLAAASSSGPARVPAVAALGQIPEEHVRVAAGGELDTSLAAQLEPLWLVQRSWLKRQEASTPLQFLQRQSVRCLVLPEHRT